MGEAACNFEGAGAADKQLSNSRSYTFNQLTDHLPFSL
ncbi:hypothetical protein KIS4809_5494 [Bacillus sp. ZZV12-4809]|nr:hypothetical protein KIS4809_5494 [Bacillus sp. ZZV12-4809]